MMNSLFSRPNSRFFIYFFLTGLLIALACIFIIQFSYSPGWDFRNNLWGPAHLAIHGKSPYNISLLFDGSNAIWLPMAISVFLPVGLLPLQIASNLWWLLNGMGLIIIVWLSSGHKRPPKLLFSITLLLSFLFPPTISHFDLGQITILICMLLIVVSVYDNKLHPFITASIFALSISKPQLMIFVIPGYLSSYFKENGSSRTLILFLFFICAICALSVPLFILYPGWFGDFVGNLNSNPVWAHPSSLFLLRYSYGETGFLLWAILFVIGQIINIVFWIRLPRNEAMTRGLVLTLLFSPYIWSWDFILLLPLMIQKLFQSSTRKSTVIIMIGYFTCWGIIAYMKVSGYSSDYLFWWIPWYLLSFLFLSHIKRLKLGGHNINIKK